MTLVTSTPENNRRWIAELKRLATGVMVWEYVDLTGSADPPILPKQPTICEYNIPYDFARVRAETYMDLNTFQRRNMTRGWKRTMQHWIMFGSSAPAFRVFLQQCLHRRNPTSPRLNALCRSSIFSSHCRRDLRCQTPRSQRSLRIKLAELRSHPSSESNIEHWVAEWENLYEEIIDMNSRLVGKMNMATNFLEAGQEWIPDVYGSSLRVSVDGKSPSFLKTTKAYRKVVESFRILQQECSIISTLSSTEFFYPR